MVILIDWNSVPVAVDFNLHGYYTIESFVWYEWIIDGEG